MFSRRALAAINTPNSEGAQNVKIRAKEEKEAKPNPLEKSHTDPKIVKNWKRSKSDSSLDVQPGKKPRLAGAAKENALEIPFTIHEDFREEKVITEVHPEKTITVDGKPRLESATIELVASTSSDIYAVEEQIEWMTSENPPDSYYKVLAKTVQASLNETLEENEKLRVSIELLKRQNENLYEVAAEAEYLAEVLKERMDREDARVEVGSQTE